jgi:hypothetical protein
MMIPMVRVSEQPQDLPMITYPAHSCVSDLYSCLRLLAPACCPTPLTAHSNRFTASQADVAVFKALKSSPDAAKYPNAARWYKHIASYEDEFPTLSGDASKPYTVYGPEVAEVTINPAKAPAAEEDDEDVDLFGSDDEEEDAEAARIREERLAEYKKKKEGKPKPAAKSMVTLDVKPWGRLFGFTLARNLLRTCLC